jgi:hypothetical protein
VSSIAVEPLVVAGLDLVAATTKVMEGFRRQCQAGNYLEGTRTSLVSRHDPSIRFTNSTISVLKPRIQPSVTDRHFLIQPAMRLRNLAHVRRTGRMSPFGCYFMAFGALVPSTDARDLVDICTGLLVKELGLTADSFQFNAYRHDHDLIGLTRNASVEVALMDEPRPFRHRFGIPGVSGRNINLCIRGPRGWADVGNIITIEGDGMTLGVELAFGTNMVLLQSLGLEHCALASAGALARQHGVEDLIAVDALHSSIVLAMDGLEPVARGRGGNYRQFLRLLAERGPTDRAQTRRAVADVARAESRVRRSASPAEQADLDLGLKATVNKVMADLQRVAPVVRDEAGRCTA